MSLFYADTSALVKLIRREPESAALATFLGGADIVSSELVVAELPRAVRRAGGTLPRDSLLALAGELLDAVGLLAIDRGVLVAAAALAEPALRTLDAIHVATALSATPLDGFVTYDERQGAAARLCHLRTVAPGA